MVDGDQRLAGGEAQPLAGEQRHHHPADQPRAGGSGDGVDLADGDVGLGQHLADEAGQDLDMGAGGDLRNDPAERAMRLVLADDRLGEDLAIAGDQRRGAVVAGGFEAEDRAPWAKPFALSAALWASAGRWTASSNSARAARRWRWRRRAWRRRRWRSRTTGSTAGSRSCRSPPAATASPTGPLAEVGGKALWTKELDQALLDGRTDASVHSMKDVETDRPATLVDLRDAAARADVRDRLIGADSLAALPQGARVGTSSPRRAAQLLRARPDLKIVPIRGNLDTRLPSSRPGEFDATLLAAAGLDRLGRKAGTPIPLDVMLPAPGQAAIGIECRADDDETRAKLARSTTMATTAAVRAERAFARALGASCHSPVAALALVRAGASAFARRNPQRGRQRPCRRRGSLRHRRRRMRRRRWPRRCWRARRRSIRRLFAKG